MTLLEDLVVVARHKPTVGGIGTGDGMIRRHRITLEEDGIDLIIGQIGKGFVERMDERGVELFFCGNIFGQDIGQRIAGVAKASRCAFDGAEAAAEARGNKANADQIDCLDRSHEAKSSREVDTIG